MGGHAHTGREESGKVEGCKVIRWNYKTGKAEPFVIPDGYECPLICSGMNRIVNCPSCGTRLRYGDAFTSMEIMTDSGLSFSVCGKCYEAEKVRRAKWADKWAQKT